MAATTFYSCLGPDRLPEPLTPPAAIDGQVDTRYFSRALAAMDRELQPGGLTVYLTFDTKALPSYGDDVVAVLIGDEWARVPDYLPRVRAVFRNLSARPNLGAPIRSPAGLSALLPAGRAAIRGLPARFRHVGGPSPATQIELPIGTFNVLDLPLTPFAERGADVFFAGSVAHAPGRLAALKAKVKPKDLTREAMLRAVDRLRERPGVAVDVHVTGSFKESAAADPGEYSRALMDSRLALVPRGATTETHRFFQALKYGCVPVTDTVPPVWFYEQAPVVRLRHWDELEGVVLDLLADPERLEGLHRRALSWWETACSEDAVGRYMARMLGQRE